MNIYFIQFIVFKLYLYFLIAELNKVKGESYKDDKI